MRRLDAGSEKQYNLYLFIPNYICNSSYGGISEDVLLLELL